MPEFTSVFLPKIRDDSYFLIQGLLYASKMQPSASGIRRLLAKCAKIFDFSQPIKFIAREKSLN